MKVAGVSILLIALYIGTFGTAYYLGGRDEFQANQAAVAAVKESGFQTGYNQGLKKAHDEYQRRGAPQWVIDYVSAYCTQDATYIAAHTADVTEDQARKFFANQKAAKTNCIDWLYTGVSRLSGEQNFILYLANGRKLWFGFAKGLTSDLVESVDTDVWE